MRRKSLAGLLCGLAFAAPPAASAAELKVFPPLRPPPEDAAFTIAVSGTREGSAGETELIVEARPTSGLPCAATPDADPGKVVIFFELVGIAFNRDGSFVAADPGDHLVCGWLVSASDQVIAGPSSAIVQVRAPALGLTLNVPRRVEPGRLLPVGMDYVSEVSRQLVVAFAPTTGCDVSPDTLLRAVGSLQTVANLADVTGSGSFAGVAVAESWGSYIVCAYLVDRAAGTVAPSPLVRGEPVQVGGPRRRCAAVGGRRRITRVGVGGISCARGRSVARRWGAARRAPRVISGLDCERRSGRRVICSGNQGEVTFSYRRPPR